MSPSEADKAFLCESVKLCNFNGVLEIVVLVVACNVNELALVSTGAPA